MRTNRFGALVVAAAIFFISIISVVQAEDIPMMGQGGIYIQVPMPSGQPPIVDEFVATTVNTINNNMIFDRVCLGSGKWTSAIPYQQQDGNHWFYIPTEIDPNLLLGGGGEGIQSTTVEVSPGGQSQCKVNA